MEYKIVQVLALLTLAVVTNGVLPTEEEYWVHKVPNSAMPQFLKELLHQKDIGNGGFHINKGDIISLSKAYAYSGTPELRHEFENLKEDGFFLEDALFVGNKLNYTTLKYTRRVKFLTPSAAEKMPFSLEELPEILKKFSVNSSMSDEAKIMHDTIRQCKGPALEGEMQICATSLESIIDFAISQLGGKMVALSSTTSNGKTMDMQKEYTIVEVRGVASVRGLVACHMLPYPYAIFFCHKNEATTPFEINLVADDGENIDALAVCHRHTINWNHNHIAFKILKVKPGTYPICHYIMNDNFIFVGK